MQLACEPDSECVSCLQSLDPSLSTCISPALQLVRMLIWISVQMRFDYCLEISAVLSYCMDSRDYLEEVLLLVYRDLNIIPVGVFLSSRLRARDLVDLL